MFSTTTCGNPDKWAIMIPSAPTRLRPPEHKVQKRILVHMRSTAHVLGMAAWMRRAPVKVQPIPRQITQDRLDRLFPEIQPSAFQAHQLSEFAAAGPRVQFFET